MKLENIINTLEENGLNEVQEIQYRDDVKVIRFFYDFDIDELKAAKSYSEDESQGDEEKEELYLTYLNDLAVDNIGEILEEIMEEEDISIQFITYGINDEEDYAEFIALIQAKENDFDIEKVVEDLDL
ncbi:hypothetical protein [Clostridium cellulovorans]|uniref:Uncharacterized protein n=1 Tax=Clostridium cellulovorans (strain ATCC 35296 / DSM 3052 / OCM 3 / 743B) TaxID=573061 RepID=D9SKB7_CLOC7|nr:hypothetical protein [Clostridium cellulovorans]ADL51413.1 hypothetical protein Clocel_1669 [Clostridium cellulovorans 743B]